MKIFNRFFLVAFLILFATHQPYAQDTQKFVDLGDFYLENGDTIKNCTLGYRTYGKLNKQKSNAILSPSWFMGTSQGMTFLVGPDKLLDSTKYHIISVDAFGNGVSSSPSNSKLQPGTKFPQFSILDMVEAQHQLLIKHLNITHLYALIGISMGGIQTYQWIVSYPDFMDKAITIVATPQPSSYDLLWMQTQLGVIEANQNSEDKGMKLVGKIMSLVARTPEYVAKNVSLESFPKFLARQEKLVDRFDNYNYAWQLKAMMKHDIFKKFNGSREKAAKTIRSQLLIFVLKRDHLVNPAPSLELANLINARIEVFDNDLGHLGWPNTIKEGHSIILQFLDSRN